MKRLLLLALLSTPAQQAFAQSVAPTVAVADGKSQLVTVVTAPGTQDELFVRGKDWLFKTYNSGKTVEQYEDKAAGKLTARARANELTWKAGLGIINDAGAFTYDLALEFKDGKARFTADNIVYKKGELRNSMSLASGANLADEYPANWPTFGKKQMQARWQQMQAETNAYFVALAQSFQAAMTKPKSDF